MCSFLCRVEAWSSHLELASGSLELSWISGDVCCDETQEIQSPSYTGTHHCYTCANKAACSWQIILLELVWLDNVSLNESTARHLNGISCCDSRHWHSGLLLCADFSGLFSLHILILQRIIIAVMLNGKWQLGMKDQISPITKVIAHGHYLSYITSDFNLQSLLYIMTLHIQLRIIVARC